MATAKEARQLIGKDATWIRRGRDESGRIVDVKGKNVLVNQHGFTDWFWLPDMHRLSAAHVITKTGGGV